MFSTWELGNLRKSKWGNSLAVRIPKPLAEDAKIKEGSILNVTISGGKIVARPAGKNKLSLKRLLARVNRRNLHTEFDFGPSDGHELW